MHYSAQFRSSQCVFFHLGNDEYDEAMMRLLNRQFDTEERMEGFFEVVC